MHFKMCLLKGIQKSLDFQNNQENKQKMCL